MYISIYLPHKIYVQTQKSWVKSLAFCSSPQLTHNKSPERPGFPVFAAADIPGIHLRGGKTKT